MENNSNLSSQKTNQDALKLKTLIIFILVLLFFALPKISQATNYYVSTAGNDSSPGTQSQPWRTIQKAANTTVAGDTVIVRAGNYNERIQVTKSGSSGAPITFQAEETVIMKGFKIVANYITVRGFEIANTDYMRWRTDVSSGVYVLGNNVIIEDNYIHDCALNGITLAGSPHNNTQAVTNNCVVRNNRLYRNGMVGIDVSGRNNLIERNEVWGTVQCHPNLMAVEGPGCPNYPAVGGLDADGMRFFGSGHIFRKNYIHDIKFGPPGINHEIGDYNDNPHIDCFQTWAGTYTEKAQNITFEQNFCDVLQSQAANENGHGFMLDGGANNLTIRNNIFKTYCGINTGGRTGAHHLYIYNNTWINNLSFDQFWPCAIGLANAPYSVVKNNIFYNQPYHTIVSTGDMTDQDIDYNLAFNSDGSTPDCFRVGNYACKNPPPAHDLWKVDPKFVNPGKEDYRLQSVSPAINAGYNLGSLVTNDYDGNSRPQGSAYDIGAYEYIQSSDTTPPAAPSGVTVR